MRVGKRRVLTQGSAIWAWEWWKKHKRVYHPKYRCLFRPSKEITATTLLMNFFQTVPLSHLLTMYHLQEIDAAFLILQKCSAHSAPWWSYLNYIIDGQCFKLPFLETWARNGLKQLGKYSVTIFLFIWWSICTKKPNSQWNSLVLIDDFFREAKVPWKIGNLLYFLINVFIRQTIKLWFHLWWDSGRSWCLNTY